MAAARGAGTAYPPGAAELTPFLSGMRVVRSLVFCVLFSRSLFVIWSFFFCHSVISLSLFGHSVISPSRNTSFASSNSIITV